MRNLLDPNAFKKSQQGTLVAPGVMDYVIEIILDPIWNERNGSLRHVGWISALELNEVGLCIVSNLSFSDSKSSNFAF